MSNFPSAYRSFLAQNTLDCEPWVFLHTSHSVLEPPDATIGAHYVKHFRMETGATFDVHLFARRRDREVFAFFLLEEGAIQDRVVRAELSYSGRLQAPAPLARSDVRITFSEWMRMVVFPDAALWGSQADSQTSLA